MAQIVIIGAGLTGLSTAYHLEKNGFYDYKIFEKEDSIGGLCRSVTQDGFTFDFSGHLLHINNAYFKEIITNLVGFENFIKKTRKSFVYTHNTYTPYPYQINLHGLPTHVIADCIKGFITRKKGKKSKKYYQWILQNFGYGFGKHFFFPYQSKLFNFSIKQLSSSWTSRFVPKTSLAEIINGGIQKNNNTIGYNATFFYPKKGGIYSFIKIFAKQIKNKCYTSFCLKKVNVKNKIIEFENGHTQTFDILISTIPLKELLIHLQETPITTLKQTSEKLLCNSVCNFNLGICKNISDKHWIYFPHKPFPFYRLGFYNNFSASMAPTECSCLYGEFSGLNKSKQCITRTLKRSIEQTKKLFKITDKDIITKKIITIPYAYVIYDFWREKNITHIHKRLHELNIYSIGRYGQWKYSSMQEAILDGKEIAQQLLKKF